MEDMQKSNAVLPENKKTIYLAGGCFWGVEGYFQRINGVVNTETGYANGKIRIMSILRLRTMRKQ